MASNYPTSLDALPNPTSGNTMLSPSHSTQHSNANDAIEAVQATLGTNPQGGSATVKDRIAAAEGALAAKATTAYVDGLNTTLGGSRARVGFPSIHYVTTSSTAGTNPVET